MMLKLIVQFLMLDIIWIPMHLLQLEQFAPQVITALQAQPNRLHAPQAHTTLLQEKVYYLNALFALQENIALMNQ